MKNEEKIMGERIYLRKLNLADVSQAYCDWLNDAEVNKLLYVKSWTMSGLKDYVAQRLKNSNCFFAGIFDKKNDLHIGTIKLEPINWRKQEAKLGLVIGNKNYWGKGIGTEATKLMVGHAFKKMGLKKIKLSVHLENKPAIGVYEKAGFKVDAIKKSAEQAGRLFDRLMKSLVTMSVEKAAKIKK
ncbi:MAG: GNAT family N-acetyltransferase [Patescibacteria group bacterium]